jgi:hypothetical protein
METNYTKTPKKARKTLVIVLAVVIIAVIIFGFIDYQGLLNTNLKSVSNMINLSESTFLNGLPFNITYNMSYTQNISNNSIFNSSQMMTVSRYGNYLNFYLLSHSTVKYYNSTLRRNVTITIPVSELIIYNSTGTINCDNNPVAFNPSNITVFPNETGFYKYTCSFNVYNISKSKTELLKEAYYTLFIKKIFMLPISDPNMSASSVLKVSTKEYNGTACNLYKVIYNKNIYYACFSTTYGIPLYMNLTVHKLNTLVKIKISSALNKAPVNSSEVLSLPLYSSFS